jgi:hypothetical protein
MPRALVVGATLAAMTLAGMTAVAHAWATDAPTGEQAARRPPTQDQVDEAWHQPQEPADAPAVAGETRRAPTEGEVGEPWRYQTSVPGRPAEPGGQPGWHCLARVPGPGGRARRAGRHPAQPQTPSRAANLITDTVTPLDGAAAPTGSPITLPATDWSFSLSATAASCPCAGRRERKSALLGT